MRTSLLTAARSVAAAMLVAAVAACGDDTPTRPSPPGSAAVSLVIAGLAPLERPGEVLQLSAIARFPDGSTRDVTAEVYWYCGNWSVANVEQGALLKATGWGTTDIVASYPGGGASARATVRVAPTGMFLIHGHVSEAGYFNLPDSTVTVTFANGDVERVTTDAAGNYTIPAQGEVTLRAEKAGYATWEQRLTVGDDMRNVLLQLERLDAPGAVHGRYTLTFTASPTCKLPAEVMQRQYSARIFEYATLLVEIGGADMEAWGWAGFTGTREGSTVRFEILDGGFADAVFVERLDPQRNLAFSGVAIGSIGDGTISAAFSGRVQVRTVSGTLVLAECSAADHRFEFVR